ncbi:MAG: NlpC/P60 family protein [Blastomonas sp.]
MGHPAIRTTGGEGGQFQLKGPQEAFDPRITPIRGDLADIALAGRFFAPHYVVPDIRTCAAVRTMVRGSASPDARALSELLHGEGFALLDISRDWAWGYCTADGYCGYVPLSALTMTGEQPEPSHIVDARGALVFAEADIKSRVLRELPMGARLAAGEASECGAFLATGDGYVSRRHVRSLDALDCDPVERAQALAGAPYLWGGRSGAALDCSGLVQLVMALAGIDVPRDSDQQLASVGRFLGDDEALKRGDLVFFPGHVGIMSDGEYLVHANAHWMQVVTEPLADVIARFPADGGDPVIGRKRIG